VITIEELRKVYSEAVHSYNDANLGASGIDAGLLAVARYVAERQRAVEPTPLMVGNAVINATADLKSIYRAMQSVAPLVVPE
jgi:hypothetical protein